MKVVIAASEADPYAKTGGLADVTGSLQRELLGAGVDAVLILPLYDVVRNNFDLNYTGVSVMVPAGGKGYLSKIYSHGKGAYFVECNEFFGRKELYGTSLGGYEDNAFRFIFFSRAVLDAVTALGLSPDVIHANDWQTGLVPLYMKTLYMERFGKTASLFTIHNLGYQGIFPAGVMPYTGLPPELFSPSGVEFYGQVNFLKAGMISATGVSTVSEGYAKEILTPEAGFGLDGVLRDRESDLTGIANGIDYGVWNPLKDDLLPASFGPSKPIGKAVCRRALIKECNLGGEAGPVAAMVGRVSSQKGIDVFLESADELADLGIRVVVLGRGEAGLEAGLKDAAKRHQGKISLTIGYDDAFAHRIYAGADMLLMPSRYEPCGLSQMIALRYGTVPVASLTGGIADTVEDYDHLKGKGTGFLFSGHSARAFVECVKRALCVYGDRKSWAAISSAGMRKDFSWKASVGRYISLYRSLIRKASA